MNIKSIYGQRLPCLTHGERLREGVAYLHLRCRYDPLDGPTIDMRYVEKQRKAIAAAATKDRIVITAELWDSDMLVNLIDRPGFTATRVWIGNHGQAAIYVMSPGQLGANEQRYPDWRKPVDLGNYEIHIADEG